MIRVFLISAFILTSLWNRDDCLRVLMSNSDCGVRNLCQQVHQVTYAIVNYPPVSGEAPDIQSKQIHYKHLQH